MVFVIFPLLLLSGLLCLAFYHRIAILMERLKVIQKERLKGYKELFYLEDAKKSQLLKQSAEHYLRLLDQQTILMIKRIKFVQKGVYCLIFSIVFAIFALLSSLFDNFDFVILFFFVFTMLLLFGALFFALREFRIMLDPIQMESQFVQKLIKEDLNPSN